jgi:hypothetical protein
MALHCHAKVQNLRMVFFRALLACAARPEAICQGEPLYWGHIAVSDTAYGRGANFACPQDLAGQDAVLGPRLRD